MSNFIPRAGVRYVSYRELKNCVYLKLWAFEDFETIDGKEYAVYSTPFSDGATHAAVSTLADSSGMFPYICETREAA